jgi:hypothetical protein
MNFFATCYEKWLKFAPISQIFSWSFFNKYEFVKMYRFLVDGYILSNDDNLKSYEKMSNFKSW